MTYNNSSAAEVAQLAQRQDYELGNREIEVRFL